MNNFKNKHCWEMGKVGYQLSKITKDIEKAGFNIKKT